MGTMIEEAQGHVERMVAELEGDDDIMPFMTIRGRDEEGIVYVGLMMPEGGVEKNHIADTMMALCALNRAVAVVFGCTSWQVTCDPKDAEAVKKAESVMPSQHPDRQEIVFLHHATADGDSYASTVLTRENNKVRLGGWSSDPRGGRVGGRFGDAIHLGMKLGAEMPPEMCEWIDEQVADGNSQQLLATFMRALGTIKAQHAAEKNA